MAKLTIKETIDNIVDELGRASEVLTKIQNGEADDVDTEIDELRDDINNTLLNELSFFKERIDLALLMSAVVNDVAVPACYAIYDVEADYDLPIENGLVDTETVYNTVEDAVKNIDY